MSLARVLLCIALSLAVGAQSDDISQRLRRALEASGKGEIAAAALAEKNFARVEELLASERPSNSGDRASLLSLLGAVEFLEGNMRSAAASFQEAARLAPLEDSDRFTLAMALIKLGNGTQSRVLLEELSKGHPERAIYVYWLGRLDYDERRYDNAVLRLQKATELDPESARAWDALGLAFDMQGRPEQALRALQQSAILNRRLAQPSPWPPHDFGCLLLRTEKPQEAEAVLREALRYNPAMPEAHYHLGRVLQKEERNKEAIDQYLAAISLDAASTDACYSLAMLYRKLHREEDAKAMFAEMARRKEAVH